MSRRVGLDESEHVIRVTCALELRTLQHTPSEGFDWCNS